MLHMLLWLYTYVSNISSVFRRMLQVFYLDVAYVANVFVAFVCPKCFICFGRMLQFFHLSIAKVDRRCGGSLSPRWSNCCGEDIGHRHESGKDGVPRQIGRDVERDGHGRGASGGMGREPLCYVRRAQARKALYG
jgi:hypothetical protein